MPDDDVTLGELGRRINQGFSDVKDDLRDMSERLERKVSLDVFEVKHNQHERRLAKLEADREKEAERRTSDRRLMFAALIGPIVVVIVAFVGQIMLNAAGWI